jgi:topoisomerase-4 subunit A
MSYVKTLFNQNFLEYASYVIKDRAIPDIADGLKPVQRRIMHSLFEVDDGKFHKVANIVGHCMKYHPHGDASIYSALVVLANKDLFIDKQGNFGNPITGDEASAARYIECRVLPFAKKVLYSPHVTEYVDSYDGRNREPVAFPAKIPVLIIQGAEGIAVGMSTKILPHNFREVLDALICELKGEEFQLFPDFPGGGLVDVSDYQDGMGKVLVRAKLDLADPKRIVIREIPFGTTTESLIQSIEAAARKGRVKVSQINDYTSEAVEIEIKLARGVYTAEVVDSLFAYTDCEYSISVNLLVIRDGVPSLMTISDIIRYHAKQLVDVLEAELKVEEGELKDKIHARTLERIFIEERIYKRIEEMKSRETVIQAVLDGFVPFQKEIHREVTEEDVERLLKIPIRRISLYDIEKARKELAELMGRLKEVRHYLKNLVPYAIGFIEGILKDTKGMFPRHTKVGRFAKVDIREIASRDLELRYDEGNGYIGSGLKSGDKLFDVSQYDRILVIRADGTYKVIDAPQKLFIGKGMLFCSYADKDELAKHVFSIVFQDKKSRQIYLKRCTIEQFILEKEYSLVPGDSKILALTTREDQEVVLSYKPKPRLKILEEAFPLNGFLVKSVKAGGVRLSAKEVKSMKLRKVKKQQ